MSVPADPVLSTSRASYVVNEGSNRQEPAATGYPDIESNGQEEVQEPGGAQARLDQFRDFVSRTCCSCVARMPAIMLVVAICLVVALLLALIPAVFVLTNAVSSESQAQVAPAIEKPAIRSGFIKNLADDDDLDETEDVPGTVHGIPMTALLPPNVSMCLGFGFSCIDDPSIVISTNKRCDGTPNCPDGSDEKNCKECQSIASCKRDDGYLVCLGSSQLCDGIMQCTDGFDEKFCLQQESSDCLEDQLLCKKNDSPICLPKNAVCDGVIDCDNAIDEEQCQYCINGAKMCKDTRFCISASMVCDGFANCADGSDEKDCDCRSCSGNQLAKCDDGTCIDEWRICDGISDCADGMDEVGCPGRCSLEEDAKTEDVMSCSDGRTYLVSEACSGLITGCQTDCGECSVEAFTCPNSKRCIPRFKVCDGVSDCSEGEDEADCDCDEDMFMCEGSGQCIDDDLRCDGIADCNDGSDERGCIKCPSESFRCEVDESCFPASARCDGIAHCTDGADETGCSCHECIGMHSTTYMCGDGSRCLRRQEVCSPYSMCPNATMADKAFCAALSLREDM